MNVDWCVKGSLIYLKMKSSRKSKVSAFTASKMHVGVKCFVNSLHLYQCRNEMLNYQIGEWASVHQIHCTLRDSRYKTWNKWSQWGRLTHDRASWISSWCPQVSVLCCEHGRRNRDSPLKISLIKDIKSPTSLVSYFARPLHISWVQSLNNYTGRQWFHLAHCRLSRLADDRASMPGEKGFFHCFSCHFSLSLLVSFLCLSATLLKILYAWINSKPCRLYHALAPIFAVGHRKIKTALACIHSEEIACQLAQIQSGLRRRRRQKKVYGFRQGCEHSCTFVFIKRMLSWWTDPVLQSRSCSDCVTQSLFVLNFLNRILSG